MSAEWATVPLGDLMLTRSLHVDPSRFADEQFALYSVPAFNSHSPEIVQGAAIGSSKQVVEPGDVLLCRIVPHIRRAWVVRTNGRRRLLASGEWIVFRSKAFCPSYLRYLLVSERFHVQFMSTVAGVGGSLLRARPKQAARIMIPLPPLEAQRRIADLLDRAGALRTSRCNTIARLDALTQAIFHEMFGDPVRNLMRWPVTTIGAVADQVTDGEHQTPTRSTEGIKLLSARNVRDGFIDFRNVDFIPLAEYERIRRRCAPRCGDILISCSGTIGRVAQVKTSEPFALVRSAALVRPKRTLLTTSFLEQYLRTPALKARMMQRANASSQANLFQGQIRELPVFLPDLALQEAFTQRATAVDALMEAQAASLAGYDRLFASLQQRAFSGEL
jgi:type I restriction enzyme, S subunit